MKKKNVLLIGTLFLMIGLLSGCSAATSEPFHTVVVNPMNTLLELNADFFTGIMG